MTGPIDPDTGKAMIAHWTASLRKGKLPFPLPEPLQGLSPVELEQLIHPVAEAFVKGCQDQRIDAGVPRRQVQFCRCLSQVVAVHCVSLPEWAALPEWVHEIVYLSAVAAWCASEAYFVGALELPDPDKRAGE
jgi:hypothetical protein